MENLWEDTRMANGQIINYPENRVFACEFVEKCLDDGYDFAMWKDGETFLCKDEREIVQKINIKCTSLDAAYETVSVNNFLRELYRGIEDLRKFRGDTEHIILISTKWTWIPEKWDPEERLPHRAVVSGQWWGRFNVMSISTTKDWKTCRGYALMCRAYAKVPPIIRDTTEDIWGLLRLDLNNFENAQDAINHRQMAIVLES